MNRDKILATARLAGKLARAAGYRKWLNGLSEAERANFFSQRGKARRTHGASSHPLYNCWRNMVKRCYEPLPIYKDWNGRGITVCKDWRDDPWAFINWAELNGWQPGLELDRRDNDGNYSPGNCRFVTDKVQANNRRSRVLTEAGKEAIRQSVIASNKRRMLDPSWVETVTQLGAKLSQRRRAWTVIKY